MEEKHAQNGFPFILIKFGHKERLEDLQKGCLYMKNLLYFIGLEKGNPTDGGGQGDMFEGQFVMYNPTVEIRNFHTKSLAYRGSANFSATGYGYEKYPVFCMFMVDSRNFVDKQIDGNKLKRSYQFTTEQVDRIAKEFGDYALMVFDADEFIHRIKNGLAVAGVTKYTKGKVRYYGPNDFDYFKDIHTDSLGAAFWKRESFAFQQEYRILAHKKVPDHLEINIGDIGDISQLLKAKDLLNSQIDIIFNIQNGADAHA